MGIVASDVVIDACHSLVDACNTIEKDGNVALEDEDCLICLLACLRLRVKTISNSANGGVDSGNLILNTILVIDSNTELLGQG